MGLRDFVSKQATAQDKKSSNVFVLSLLYTIWLWTTEMLIYKTIFQRIWPWHHKSK